MRYNNGSCTEFIIYKFHNIEIANNVHQKNKLDFPFFNILTSSSSSSNHPRHMTLDVSCSSPVCVSVSQTLISTMDTMRRKSDSHQEGPQEGHLGYYSKVVTSRVILVWVKCGGQKEKTG